MIAKSVRETTMECFDDFRRVLKVLCRFPRVMLWSVAFPANEVLHIAQYGKAGSKFLLRVKDFFNFPFLFTIDDKRWWLRRDTAGNGVDDVRR